MLTIVKFDTEIEAMNFLRGCYAIGVHYISVKETETVTFGHRLCQDEINAAIRIGAKSIEIRPHESITTRILLDQALGGKHV